MAVFSKCFSDRDVHNGCAIVRATVGGTYTEYVACDYNNPSIDELNTKYEDRLDDVDYYV